MKIEVVDNPSSKDAAVIYDGLSEFNEPHFPNLDVKTIGCFIRDDNERVIGGLTAKTLLTSLHVDFLWLSDSLRGTGAGSSLLSKIESEALKYGAERVYVDTYSFQAPGFYEKHGFREVGRYSDYPRVGVDKIFYTKKLDRT